MSTIIATLPRKGKNTFLPLKWNVLGIFFKSYAEAQRTNTRKNMNITGVLQCNSICLIVMESAVRLTLIWALLKFWSLIFSETVLILHANEEIKRIKISEGAKEVDWGMKCKMPLRLQSNMIVDVLCFYKPPDTLTYFLLGVEIFFPC